MEDGNIMIYLLIILFFMVINTCLLLYHHIINELNETNFDQVDIKKRTKKYENYTSLIDLISFISVLASGAIYFTYNPDLLSYKWNNILDWVFTAISLIILIIIAIFWFIINGRNEKKYKIDLSYFSYKSSPFCLGITTLFTFITIKNLLIHYYVLEVINTIHIILLILSIVMLFYFTFTGLPNFIKSKIRKSNLTKRMQLNLEIFTIFILINVILIFNWIIYLII